MSRQTALKSAKKDQSAHSSQLPSGFCQSFQPTHLGNEQLETRAPSRPSSMLRTTQRQSKETSLRGNKSLHAIRSLKSLEFEKESAAMAGAIGHLTMYGANVGPHVIGYNADLPDEDDPIVPLGGRKRQFHTAVASASKI